MARILLVHPGLGWAFQAMAESIAKYAGPDNHVMPMSQSDFEAIAKWAKPDALGRLDAAFHFSLGSASILRRLKAARYGSLVANEGWCYDAYDPGDWRTNAAAGERNARFGKDVATSLDCLICLTPRILETVGEWNERAVALPQGLDMEFWSPAAVVPDEPAVTPDDGEKKEDEEEEEVRADFRVGWCGDISGTQSFKGHAEVLVPLRKRLCCGYDWQVNIKDYRKAATRREMRAWYRDLDVFVCTSINEGGPYPPFEAAACGCPVVSTDVGMVSGWEELRKLDLIAKPCMNEQTAEVTLDELEARIVGLRDDPVRREKVGNCLRNSVIENYNWERLAPKWIEAMVGDA